MPTSIYCCFYIDEKLNPSKRIFYVGRSIDVFRRIKQHNYAKKNGHEDKYEFIRELEASDKEWNFEILREIPDNEYPFDNERWFVIKLIREGHNLTNMRYGSEERRKEISEQVESTHIRNVADVVQDRIKREQHQIRRKYAASKRTQRRVISSTLQKIGVPDVSVDELLPRVLHRRLIKHGVTSIESGVTLSEIFRLVRAFPQLEKLCSQTNNHQLSKKSN